MSTSEGSYETHERLRAQSEAQRDNPPAKQSLADQIATHWLEYMHPGKKVDYVGYHHMKAGEAVAELFADRVLEAVTTCKINDALALTRYAGSTIDAAKQILRDANIKRAEVLAVVKEPADRERLLPLLKGE
jgi:hypothetical protein